MLEETLAIVITTIGRREICPASKSIRHTRMNQTANLSCTFFPSSRDSGDTSYPKEDCMIHFQNRLGPFLSSIGGMRVSGLCFLEHKEHPLCFLRDLWSGIWHLSARRDRTFPLTTCSSQQMSTSNVQLRKMRREVSLAGTLYVESEVQNVILPLCDIEIAMIVVE